MLKAVSNCTICQEPVQGGMLSQFFALPQSTYSFPCRHEFHQSCIQRAVDRALTESRTELSCPNCREVTPITLKRSEMTILDWTNKVQTFAALLGPSIGTTLGIRFFQKIEPRIDSSSVLAVLRQYPVAYKVSKYTIYFFISIVFRDVAATLTQYTVTRTAQALTASVTAFYNWKNSSQIKPLNVGLVRASLMEDRAKQVHTVCEDQLENVIPILSSQLSYTEPFKPAEQAIMKAWLDALKGLKLEEIVKDFQDYLKNQHGDLYRTIEVQGYCFWSLDPETDHELLDGMKKVSFLFLEEKLKSLYLRSNDPRELSNYAVIYQLQLMKGISPDEARSAEWIQFLSELQDHYRSNPSELDVLSYVGLRHSSELFTDVMMILHTDFGQKFHEKGFSDFFPPEAEISSEGDDDESLAAGTSLATAWG